VSFLAAHAALVTPLSGPYAVYGQAGAHALGLWAGAGAAAGLPRPGAVAGLRRGALGPVALTVFDAHPDPAAAWRKAEAAAPHLLFGPYGSGPARAVATVASRLWWNHGGAEPGAGRAPAVDLLASASSYHVGTLRTLVAADPSLRSVTVVHGRSGFGRAVGEGALAEAGRLGLEAVAVPLASAEALAAANSHAAGGVLLVAGSFEEELAVARQALPGPWSATSARACSGRRSGSTPGRRRPRRTRARRLRRSSGRTGRGPVARRRTRPCRRTRRG
jgi:branched-chain amino acid transport system substrate-binding protein